MPARSPSQRGEQRKLREQMLELGMSRAEIAAEMSRRYRLRPRAAWRTAWGWTLEEAAERYNALHGSGAEGDMASLTGPRLSEWENWPLSSRRPSVTGLFMLAEAYECDAVDLIDLSDREKLPRAELIALGKTRVPSPARRQDEALVQGGEASLLPARPAAPGEFPPPGEAGEARSAGRGDGLLAAGMALTGSYPPGEYGPATGWPSWFGVRLARVITLVDGWRDPAQLDSLQSLLHEEIVMSEAATPRDQPQAESAHALSRRHALMTLAALPAAVGMPGAAGDLSSGGGTEYFLSRCAASLASCWHLLNGTELQAVEQVVSAFMMPLEAVALRPSRYQPTAARLATQAHRICGILAFHRNQMPVREQHNRRALQYAAIAADAGSHASALLSLASYYFFASDPARAAVLYEQVFSHGAALPQLLRSRAHGELAVAYAQLGREQDAIKLTGQAEELYPSVPEQDPSSLYAEFAPGKLALQQGLTYIALADQFPGRGYEHKAADVFSQAGQAGSPMPDRTRFQIINHQACTAVLLDDLDAFEALLSQGIEGATMLGSRQRMKEAHAIWQRAAARWPGEKRVLALSDGLPRPAVTADA